MALAARSARNLDAGEEKIEDKASATAHRRRAGVIYGYSLALAGVLVLIALFISGAFL